MILGVGTDIIEIARVHKVFSQHGDRFLQRVFTSYEIEYCLKKKNSSLHFAARFAAKEAVMKALGTGLRGLTWLDIGIRNDALGKPTVVFPSLPQGSMFLSLSHCKEYATAFVVWST